VTVSWHCLAKSAFPGIRGKKCLVWGLAEKELKNSAKPATLPSGVFFPQEVVMAKSRHRPKFFVVHKPQGQIQERVRTIGPEHFGIVSVDCAKVRSKFFLCDFYGKVFIPPTVLPHTQHDLQTAIQRIRQATADYDLRDILVAIERTGTYHRPVQDAFRKAQFETRLVHPFASRQFRQPADPANKTDDTDLAGIFRASVNGFGLLDPIWPEEYQQLQAIARYRRDLVRKQAKLRCQIRSQLHSLMPGYADCFDDPFVCPAALLIAHRTGSAKAVRTLGLLGLRQLIAQAGVHCRTSTLTKILAWASTAVEPIAPMEARRHILAQLDADRCHKNQEIIEQERELACLLVRTPYVLLLAIPGLNVPSVAELAGELGPMTSYANANRITGRAGLRPSRYQSDTVDRANGGLRLCANRRLRNALMQIADNLVSCNHHFSVQALALRQRDKDPRWIRVKVAKTFTRIAFAMVTGRTLFPHPCCQQRHYILDKLLAFHRYCDMPMSLSVESLDAATLQLPRSCYAQEAQPLQQRLQHLQQRRGPQPLAEILPIVLARLGSRVLPSPSAEERDPS
jgi:transposase